jgi:hypothetical protein
MARAESVEQRTILKFTALCSLFDALKFSLNDKKISNPAL